MPDDTVLEMNPDRHTAIVALTHDPKLDDMALIEALQSSTFYVGAIGARRNQALRKERLKEFGVTDEQLARLHGPVGLKNGACTPPEIATSIIAEMTAVKYGYVIAPPARVGGSTSHTATFSGRRTRGVLKAVDNVPQEAAQAFAEINRY